MQMSSDFDCFLAGLMQRSKVILLAYLKPDICQLQLSARTELVRWTSAGSLSGITDDP